MPDRVPPHPLAPSGAFLVDRSGTPDLTHAQTLSGRFVITSRGVRLPAAQAEV